MDSRGLRVTQNAYFSLLTHTKKLLLVTYCDLTAETGVSFQTHGMETDGQTDVIVQIVIYIVSLLLNQIQIKQTFLDTNFELGTIKFIPEIKLRMTRYSD